ncbi:hypothetical protein ACVIHA_002880 [Bradyrhizobium liaoningense]
MPLLAYFWKVGAALLALLFVADFCLPKAAVTEKTAVEQPAILIHSDRKWPERVVLDTTMRAIVAIASTPSITEPTPSSLQQHRSFGQRHQRWPMHLRWHARICRRAKPSSASGCERCNTSQRGRNGTEHR